MEVDKNGLKPPSSRVEVTQPIISKWVVERIAAVARPIACCPNGVDLKHRNRLIGSLKHSPSKEVKGSLRAPESGSLRIPSRSIVINLSENCHTIDAHTETLRHADTKKAAALARIVSNLPGRTIFPNDTQQEVNLSLDFQEYQDLSRVQLIYLY